MTKETLKHYVHFFMCPESSVSENSSKEIEGRDTKIDAPKNSFAYQFFDRQEYVAQDGEVLVGRSRNHSGTHYFGKIMNLEDVQREVPNSHVLRSNMRDNEWDKVVKTRFGDFQLFEKDDVIVAEE